MTRKIKFRTVFKAQRILIISLSFLCNPESNSTQVECIQWLITMGYTRRLKIKSVDPGTKKNWTEEEEIFLKCTQILKNRIWY